jgi:hypothetical protein
MQKSEQSDDQEWIERVGKTVSLMAGASAFIEQFVLQAQNMTGN